MSSSEIQKLKELLRNSYKQIQDLQEENEKLKDIPYKPPITKNTKGNRIFLGANYTIESYFKLPDDLDLEDKSIVENWWVKHDTLNIKYVNKEEVEEIEPEIPYHENMEGMCLTYPNKTYFGDVDDCFATEDFYDNEEDDEDDEDEEE